MDVGMITNNGNAAANTHAANTYATNTFVAKETKQTDNVKKYGAPGRTIGQAKLSEKAREYYEELKAKYQDMDFILVSKDMKEMAKANAGSYANPHKMVVLIDEEKIERMASDEEFRKQYEGLIATAQKKMPELKQAFSTTSNVKGYGMQVNDNGTASFFAVMSKSFDEQAQRIEKRRVEKLEEKKAAEKKAQKEQQKEWLEEKRAENKETLEKLNSENVQDLFGEYKNDDVVIISAGSVEGLLRKVEDYNFAYKADTIKTEAEKYVGTVIDFKG